MLNLSQRHLRLRVSHGVLFPHPNASNGATSPVKLWVATNHWTLEVLRRHRPRLCRQVMALAMLSAHRACQRFLLWEALVPRQRKLLIHRWMLMHKVTLLWTLMLRHLLDHCTVVGGLFPSAALQIHHVILVLLPLLLFAFISIGIFLVRYQGNLLIIGCGKADGVHVNIVASW